MFYFTLKFVALLFLHTSFMKGDIAVSADVSSSTHGAIIVELAIFCDKEFSDSFQQDREKIINYWAAYIWDVNMRFKTISIQDISFRVTSLNIIMNTSDQPYIESERRNGQVYLSGALGKFAKMIYQEESNLPNFDIAILMSGANATSQTLKYDHYGATVCRKSEYSDLHKSTLMLHQEHACGYECTSLERALGDVLGLQCNDSKHSLPDRICSTGQYFMSRCSQSRSAKFFSSLPSCLRFRNDSIPDALENATATHPPSLEAQCKMITKNDHAQIQGNSSCLLAKCYVPLNGSLKFARNLYPVDNSPCDIDKFCFRGRCLSQGYLLQNVHSGKCVGSSNRFSVRSYSLLVNCAAKPTPLDQVRNIGNGNTSVILAMPYSGTSGTENRDKYLSVSYGGKVKYTNGVFEKTWLYWNLLRVNGSNKFLLLHPFTNTCAEINNNPWEIYLSNRCNDTDDRMLWRFIGENETPSDWFMDQRQLTGTPSLSTTQASGNTDEIPGRNFQEVNQNNQTGRKVRSTYQVSTYNSLAIFSVSFIIGFVGWALLVYFLWVKKLRHLNMFRRYRNQENINYEGVELERF